MGEGESLIRISSSAGHPTIESSISGPAVYLDHWALRRLSEDQEASERVRESLVAQGGTLCLSFANQAEFVKVNSKSSQTAAEDLIGRFMPHLFVLEFNPWVVVEREDAWMAGDRSRLPHLDVESVNVWFEVIGPGPAVRLGLGPIFQDLEEATQAIAGMKELYRTKVEERRSEYREDRELRRLFHRPAPTEKTPYLTRYLIPEVLRPQLDRSGDVDPNDALDFLHTVVPVAYCDLVVLDRDWADRAQRAIRRLRDAGHTSPLAEPVPVRGWVEGLVERIDGFGQVQDTG